MSDIFQTDEYVVNDNPYLDQGSGGGGADLDSLATSTNAMADADLVVSKEGNTWYKKAASKIWDYIKSKIQASSNEVAYGTCSTAAATAAKVATLDTAGNWKLKKGTIVCIKFTNTNTAQNPTLNVNNSGAKSIYYNTAVITTGSLFTAGEANRYTSYMYDGTNWVWIGSSIDRNTTYSAMSTAELTTGTATNSRVVRADYLHNGIEQIAESSDIDTANNTATFTSSDTTDANATSWTSVTKLDSGESHSSIFAKMSQMFKNIRYLYKMLGTTDISQIGGGNVTGAISALNTSLTKSPKTVTVLPTTATTRNFYNSNHYVENGTLYLTGRWQISPFISLPKNQWVEILQVNNVSIKANTYGLAINAIGAAIEVYINTIGTVYILTRQDNVTINYADIMIIAQLA